MLIEHLADSWLRLEFSFEAIDVDQEVIVREPTGYDCLQLERDTDNCI